MKGLKGEREGRREKKGREGWVFHFIHAGIKGSLNISTLLFSKTFPKKMADPECGPSQENRFQQNLKNERWGGGGLRLCGGVGGGGGGGGYPVGSNLQPGVEGPGGYI